MKHVLVGTAGHVDHGKTTLIHALTGTDTDRLQEEKERGMSIDLGFACLTLPDGNRVSVVDVPGHEKFLKNMLAGAGGVDVALLVVAADEGMMPQTWEHLNILKLLQVKRGVVAITRADLADKETLAVCRQNLVQQLAGSFLEKAPVVVVSAVTGRGLNALKHAIMTEVSKTTARAAQTPFRMYIDRVFVRSGYGTVVTGTLVSGTLHKGDKAQLVPSSMAVKVRYLQIHGQQVPFAEAGNRVAVNIAGESLETIRRGEQLALPGAVSVTARADVCITLLPDTKVNHNQRLRMYIGSAEVIGRMHLLEKNIDQADGVLCQFIADKEFACQKGDKVVFRSLSPLHTLAGGIVLDPMPKPHKKGEDSVLAFLKGLMANDTVSVFNEQLKARLFIEADAVHLLLKCSAEEADSILQSMIEKEEVALLDNTIVIHTAQIQNLINRVVSILDDYHHRFPLRQGIPRDELKTLLQLKATGRQTQSILQYLRSRQIVELDGLFVRLPDFRVSLSETQQAQIAAVADYYTSCGVNIPEISIVSRELKMPPDTLFALIKAGVQLGKFISVSDGCYYSAETFQTLQKTVEAYSLKKGGITVAELRDELHTNRKMALIALEFLDSKRITVRQENCHVFIQNNRTLQ